MAKYWSFCCCVERNKLEKIGQGEVGNISLVKIRIYLWTTEGVMNLKASFNPKLCSSSANSPIWTFLWTMKCSTRELNQRKRSCLLETLQVKVEKYCDKIQIPKWRGFTRQKGCFKSLITQHFETILGNDFHGTFVSLGYWNLCSLLW